jgi:Kae1-associated kinase Bud32
LLQENFVALLMLIKQGAEARAHVIPFLDRKAIAKQRFKKEYRHPVLDERLTKERVAQEARQLQRLRGILRTPTVYLVDIPNATIYMEYFDYPSVRETIQEWEKSPTECESQILSLGKRIGEELALIHNFNCIHGDLTTSNMLYNDKEVVWIDFGLSYVSTLAEDKGSIY